MARRSTVVGDSPGLALQAADLPRLAQRSESCSLQARRLPKDLMTRTRLVFAVIMFAWPHAARAEPAPQIEAKGIDVDLVAGWFAYAEDTDLPAAGVRASWWQLLPLPRPKVEPLVKREVARTRAALVFEYLQTIDKHGGILRVGGEVSSTSCHGICTEIGFRPTLAVPWGRDLDRDGSVLGNYTFSVDIALGLFGGLHLRVSDHLAIGARLSVDGGLNASKGIANAFRCGDGRCESDTVGGEPDDGYPNWPSFHWTITGAVTTEVTF